MANTSPNPFVARLIAAFITAFVMVASSRAEDAISLPLAPNADIHFSTADEAKKILATRDRFTAAMSPWDRQARLKTDRAIDEAEYLKFAGDQAIAWEAKDREKLTKVVTAVRERLRPWTLPWPKKIHFIQTSGNEEGRAAYCRAGAIVLPKNVVARNEESLERLVLHELFHILSSHNPRLRDRLYEVVGFKPCREVPLPADLAARKITNPDAPTIEHAIAIESGGKTLAVVPILLAHSEKYDANGGGEFFRQMDFRLLVVAPTDPKNEKNLAPALKDGKPQLLDPSATPGYLDRIGRNTGYIIHPDEILADNFVLLVMSQKDAPSPRILDDLATALKHEHK